MPLQLIFPLITSSTASNASAPRTRVQSVLMPSTSAKPPVYEHMSAFRSVLKDGVLGEGLVKVLVLTAYLTTSTCLILKTFSTSVWHFNNLNL